MQIVLFSILIIRNVSIADSMTKTRHFTGEGTMGSSGTGPARAHVQGKFILVAFGFVH